MAPRRRKPENRDLPIGLHIKKSKGHSYFIYHYPEGGPPFPFPAGTSRQDAIQATLAFNQQTRSLPAKIRQKGDPYNKPLSDWLPKIEKRIRQEEKFNTGTLKTFLNDVERLKSYGGDTYTKSIDLQFVNGFLEKFTEGKSANVYNRKISFLSKVFEYLVDESAMGDNPAQSKKKKPTGDKKRVRLTWDNLVKIHKASPRYLQIAIELAYETTHAVLEVHRMKYRDCSWLDIPQQIEGINVHGYMRIHRQKVHHLEASYVEIPITDKLKAIIERSREDRVLSPYIVHNIGRYRDKLGENCDHPTQVSDKTLSRKFSEVRDNLGLYAHIKVKRERASFHEIRALSARNFKDQGIDPQQRMAHKDPKSTMVYTENHINWTRVCPAVTTGTW